MDKMKFTRYINEETDYGECYEHNIRWYGGGLDCPVCRLTNALEMIAHVSHEPFVVDAARAVLPGYQPARAGSPVVLDDAPIAAERK